MSQVSQSDQPNVHGGAPPSRRGKIRLLALLLVLAGAGIVPEQSPGALYLRRPQVDHRRPAGPGFGIRLAASEHRGRPVMLLSLAVNYQLGHLDVRGYHVFNFVVHASPACCCSASSAEPSDCVIAVAAGICPPPAWLCRRPAVARSSPADGKRHLRDPALRIDDGDVFPAVPVLCDPGVAGRTRLAVVRGIARRLPAGPGVQGSDGRPHRRWCCCTTACFSLTPGAMCCGGEAGSMLLLLARLWAWSWSMLPTIRADRKASVGLAYQN